jgi:hypothetical protein
MWAQPQFGTGSSGSELLDRAAETLRAESVDVGVDDSLLNELPPPHASDTNPTDDGIPLDQAKSDHIEVRILGPVEVAGWAEVPERSVLTELLCYLALHRRQAVSGDALRAALRPEGAVEQSAKTLRTYLSSLRRALGPGVLPEGRRGGYCLSDQVRTDWDRFNELRGRDDLDSLLEALGLVRGRPFEGVPAGGFGWVFSEFWISDIELGVAAAAKEAAVVLEEQDDLRRATWALRQGLLASPSDFGLWERYLSVARQSGPRDFERAEREAVAALGDDAPGRPRPDAT